MRKNVNRAAEGEVRGRFLVWMDIGEAHLAWAEGLPVKARRLSEMGISRDSEKVLPEVNRLAQGVLNG